jgi:hypothetical protein
VRRTVRLGAALLALVGGGVAASGVAGADSFTPVVLSITVASTAHLHQALAIKITVTADPGALDTRTAAMRLEVKLAPECGGTYRYTPGVILLNQQLKPQPDIGRAYSATAHGSGKPSALGLQTVCVWLQEAGDQRVFASDQSNQVDVLKAKKLTKKKKGGHK